MISLTCPHCARALQVRSDFVGTAVRCPACQQTITQITSAATQPAASAGYILTGKVRGDAPHVEGASPPARGAATGLREPPPVVAPSRQAPPRQRYSLGAEIGRGGMGTVVRALDRDLQREVAVKYLLDSADAAKKQRFIEEAQVTGQLEHPNIVPVHELGTDSQQRVFFTMKVVKGESLAQILDALRRGDPAAEKEWPLPRLLNVFVAACHALGYAHARGVIHRDLKPANIMMGKFGEVYVMDWGVAKRIKSENSVTVASPEPAPAPPRAAVPGAPGSAVPSAGGDPSLTQEGTVLGTPAYMPPEQAMGKLQAIDARSDVYALGAVLYEMLTLEPPVDRTGGNLAVLLRVAEGEIVPPQKRNPQRARAGLIPAELAAIAMKALAKQPEDRYAGVERMRQDIERFQEGRSVSAKQDTTRELLWKFAKRNRALSVAAAVGVPLLLASLVLVIHAWWQADQAYAAYRHEQEERQRRTKEAVPAFVEAARLAIDRRRFENATAQVNLALEYDPTHPDARLLKAQLLVQKKQFAEAQSELAFYLRQRPNDAAAVKLRDLCEHPRGEDVSFLLTVARALEEGGAPTLAESLLAPHGRNSFEARQHLLGVYQQRIEIPWPGLSKFLSVDPQGIYRLELRNRSQVSDLTVLEGMPLTHLVLYGNNGIRDLTPLRGMPLTSLDLGYCGQLNDLSPLKNMPLRTLNLEACGQVRDLTPLRGMPLTSLNLRLCAQVHDLSPLEGLELTDIHLVPRNISQGMDGLRRMKSLKNITAMSNESSETFAAQAFWEKYDAGEFKR